MQHGKRCVQIAPVTCLCESDNATTCCTLGSSLEWSATNRSSLIESQAKSGTCGVSWLHTKTLRNPCGLVYDRVVPRGFMSEHNTARPPGCRRSCTALAEPEYAAADIGLSALSRTAWPNPGDRSPESHTTLTFKITVGGTCADRFSRIKVMDDALAQKDRLLGWTAYRIDRLPLGLVLVHLRGEDSKPNGSKLLMDIHVTTA